MRVRWQKTGEAAQVKCDMSYKKAEALYIDLERNPLIEWAELVDEDDNYMDILERFDHIERARHIKKMLGSLIK